uniref:Uncharacterized protein n=1 Tax=Myoviridae sp. ctYA416 TaxID=2825125 RepID=A0A8S5UTP1_9CAUD|nr:MAG TPA: hypothetical protein [Myoviridae sp. ctYA416]
MVTFRANMFNSFLKITQMFRIGTNIAYRS